MLNKIDFSSKFKIANYISLTIFIISIIFIFFKGLNYGIDFKGGTLIELKVENTNINIKDIRSALKSMELGDVNVKEFGKKTFTLLKLSKKLKIITNKFQ